jgi:hypothetical protein
VPDIAGFGRSSIPGVTARDRFPPIRLPRRPCRASRQPRTMDEPVMETSTQMRNGDHCTLDPEGPVARWPVRLDHRGVRRGSRRLGSRPRCRRRDAPGMLTTRHRNRTTLFPKPDEPAKAHQAAGLATLGGHGKPQPTGTSQIADQTTIRPHAPSVTAIARHLSALSPTGAALEST